MPAGGIDAITGGIVDPAPTWLIASLDAFRIVTSDTARSRRRRR